jgi:4-amino-4-deoxy-L-arabinose transferase-like glycosyltransferase
MATGAWALQPQLFAMAHYATYDAILSSLWVGAILAFSRAVSPGDRGSWGWSILFGVLCGWAADTKLTGWFLPLPFVAWAILTRSRRGLFTLAIGAAVGLVTLYLFNPAWWADPIGGVIRFFQSNLSRGKTIPIEVLFLGRVYRTPVQSLPWYNTLVWTAIATPVGFLAFALAGSIRSARAIKAADPLPILALGHWLFLLLLRALPHTPGHDGVRQFLPAFGCLAIVAGVGAAWAVARLGRWGKILIAASLIEGAVSVAVMMPVPLSYFSPIVGGLPGAARIGMEPTYFWDGLTPEALDTLNRRAEGGEVVQFATYPTTWLYLQRKGKLRVDLWPMSRRPPTLYVLQNRPGAFRPEERAWVKQHGADRLYILSEKFDVPLVWLFPRRLLIPPGGVP